MVGVFSLSISPYHGDCFFFSSRRRHTSYWRDGSSDVCSSDLRRGGRRRQRRDAARQGRRRDVPGEERSSLVEGRRVKRWALRASLPLALLLFAAPGASAASCTA